jgi:hypothetical protein
MKSGTVRDHERTSFITIIIILFDEGFKYGSGAKL